MKIWPGLHVCGAQMNVEAYFFRAREGDKANFGMLNQGLAGFGAALAEVHNSGRQAAILQQSKKIAAMVGASGDGFSTTVLPQTIAAKVIPARIARGKFHGGITAPGPSGIWSKSPDSPGS